MDPKKIIMAHRGWPARYPENSIPGIVAAMEAGFKNIEYDVQIARDGVPVIVHDEDMYRVSGKQGNVIDLDWEVLKHFSIGEPSRFGNQFKHIKLASLEELADLWCQELSLEFEGSVFFCEIKIETARQYGISATVDNVMAALESMLSRTVLISFSAEVLTACRSHANYNKSLGIGFCLENYDNPSLNIGRSLKPNYMLCNFEKVPLGEQLEQGPWTWGVWEIVDPMTATRCLQQGALLLDSMCCVELAAEMQNYRW